MPTTRPPTKHKANEIIVVYFLPILNTKQKRIYCCLQSLTTTKIEPKGLKSIPIPRYPNTYVEKILQVDYTT